MLIEEIIGTVEELDEAKLVYARSGRKVVRKYRCSTVPIISSLNDIFSLPI